MIRTCGHVSKGRQGPRKAGAARPARRLWHVSPEGFGELRRSCLLSRKAAAEFLGVSLRTVAYWEAGRCRVPWSVVRLLRIVRLGDLGALSRDRSHAVPLAGWLGRPIVLLEAPRQACLALADSVS